SSSHPIVLASSPDGTIIAYDAYLGVSIAHFTGCRSPRKGLVIAGTDLVAASHVSPDTGAGSIYLYNWWSSTVANQIPLTEPVGPLAVTLDGAHILAGGISGHIHAVSLPAGHLVQTFPAHSKHVSCLAVSNDGTLLFSGSDDGTIAVYAVSRVLNPSRGSQFPLRYFAGHDSTVTSITSGIRASNCALVSCSLDYTCKFWSLMHDTPLYTVAFPCTVWGVEMDPSDSEFYAAGSDGFVYSGTLRLGRRNPARQKQVLVPSPWGKQHDGAVIALSMMNGGQFLATASENGSSIWIWNVSTKQVVNVLGERMGGCISELIVAKVYTGDTGGRRSGLNAGQGNDGSDSGFASRELSRPIRDVMNMEQMAGAQEQDRNKSVSILGSTIKTYKKLWKHIGKEAKGGTSSGSGHEAEDDDDDK
ncbi:protein ROOT INITIATION DEFECTIVE 3-like, partial [Diospyros lotus]|uniref:protein ROOT INITIATION DEFECTIVE 3-like n=1 Tax=Diospyros lotus TaxID=55363 RepID=UPI00224E2B41